MTDQFPNIKRLGLEVRYISETYAYLSGAGGSTTFEPQRQARRELTVVYAEELEKLLSSAPVVTSYGTRNFWAMHDERNDSADTHTALLVGIQPIVKDSETQSAIEQLQSKLNEAMAKVKELMEMVNK